MNFLISRFPLVLLMLLWCWCSFHKAPVFYVLLCQKNNLEQAKCWDFPTTKVLSSISVLIIIIIGSENEHETAVKCLSCLLFHSQCIHKFDFCMSLLSGAKRVQLNRNDNMKYIHVWKFLSFLVSGMVDGVSFCIIELLASV